MVSRHGNPQLLLLGSRAGEALQEVCRNQGMQCSKPILACRPECRDWQYWYSVNKQAIQSLESGPGDEGIVGSRMEDW